MRIAITGGIGSGKSYVCQRLERLGYPVFYCDAEAKKIIRQSPVVREQLTALVGEEVYRGGGLQAADYSNDNQQAADYSVSNQQAAGQLNKSVLAAYICQSPQHADRVDAIVHPQVAKAFEAWAAQQISEIVFMECALLFESGFDRLVDRVALVVVDEATRLSRVMHRDNISEEKARAWMALQMPEEEKAARADVLIRNYDGEDAENLLTTDLKQLVNL